MTRSRNPVGVLAALLVLCSGVTLGAEPAAVHMSPSERSAPIPATPGDARSQVPERQLFEPVPVLPPTFLPPLSRPTDSGRVGVGGWSAPRKTTPSGPAGDVDGGGWLGFGIAGEWGHPGKGRN